MISGGQTSAITKKGDFYMATFSNTATLSYNGITTSSNTTAGELLEQLSISKTAVSPEYSVGDDITYIISLTNTGTAALTDITLTDDLGSYTYETLTLTPLDYTDNSVRYFSSGILQPAPAVTKTDNGIEISGITVPAGGNAAIIYEALPNRFASPEADGKITNTALASGNAVQSSVSASETVNASAAAKLSITKSLSPTSVVPNDRLTYTFVISNLGNTAASGNDIIMNDTFDPILTSVTVSFNEAAQTEGEFYTYDEETGSFATLPGQLTVPAAEYTRDPLTGEWTVIPGTSAIIISGTV